MRSNSRDTPFLSVLVLHSISDGLTQGRIERAARESTLATIDCRHAFALEEGEDYHFPPGNELRYDLSHVMVAPNVEQLAARLSRLVSESHADLLIVHAGFVAHSYPDAVFEAVRRVKRQYPDLTLALQGRLFLSAAAVAGVLDGLTFSEGPDVQRVIDAIF